MNGNLCKECWEKIRPERKKKRTKIGEVEVEWEK